jgi:hypothetical protein
MIHIWLQYTKNNLQLPLKAEREREREKERETERESLLVSDGKQVKHSVDLYQNTWRHIS